MNNALDQQTLQDLEFDQIQHWLKGFAIGPSAEKQLGDLQPSSQFKWIENELQLVFDMFKVKTEGISFPALEFEELQKEIKLLPIQNAVLEEEGFVRISLACHLGNRLVQFHHKYAKVFPFLAEVVSDIDVNDAILPAIAKVFDPKGQIKDKASGLLYENRQQQQSLKNRINRNFEKELRKLNKEGVLADTNEAFIDNKRVLAIVSTYKRSIEGQVMGSSKSGSLTFIEPAANVPLNRELDLLKDEERIEIRRILQALTAEIAIHIDLIKLYNAAFIELDRIQAKARLAISMEATIPKLNREGEMELINAYHPILWKANKGQNKKTVPQQLTMNRNGRMLVISGPNAGGKSITLKTVGLLQIMLQSGLLVPVDPNSKMFFFQQILSDIGDNQSIANELSTYSYRLQRMNTFLQKTNKSTLLLLDEFGTGSDPDLGGALAEVFFEELYHKKAFGVITTHYANIKLKANQLKNAVNGCMLFDTDTLAPLYRFSMGQPGSSFTFEVAQINGIPLEIIEDAKSRIQKKRVEMDSLLTSLQKEKTYLEGLNNAHIEAQEIAQEAKVRYEEKEERYKIKLQQINSTIEKNDVFIEAGKTMRAFVDKFNIISKKKNANDIVLIEVKDFLHAEKSKLREVKLTKATKKEPKKLAPKQQKKIEDQHQQEKIVLDSKVKLISTKQSGTVEDISGNQITVSFGFARMKVSRDKLSFLQ
jgi:DNA mismatch repair protein MutS2